MSYCRSLPDEFAAVPDSAPKMLEEAREYIVNQLNQEMETSTSFVCEHNSRKGHLGHVLTQMAILSYKVGERHDHLRVIVINTDHGLVRRGSTLS